MGPSLMAGFRSPLGMPPTGNTRTGLAAERVVGETDGAICGGVCPAGVCCCWSSRSAETALEEGAAAEAGAPAEGKRETVGIMLAFVGAPAEGFRTAGVPINLFVT